MLSYWPKTHTPATITPSIQQPQPNSISFRSSKDFIIQFQWFDGRSVERAFLTRSDFAGNKFQQKLITQIKIILLRIFYLNYQYYLQDKQKEMKICSPFVEHIPECKRTMRRLRKKIYKFITSKNYTKKQRQSSSDLTSFLAVRPLPNFIVQHFAKRKILDLAAIKTLAAPPISLREVAAITQEQERQVMQLQAEWLESNRNKSRLRAYAYLEGFRERESFSKRTISSTEFEEDEEEMQDDSPLFAEYLQEVGQNLNQDLQFHHFTRGNSFLQIESSILSQENLFKFQQ